MYEDFLRNWKHEVPFLESSDGDIQGLILKFRSFYKDAHRKLFNCVVREIWLEQQVVIDGRVRTKRRSNGMFVDRCFSKFTKFAVGYTHRVLASNDFFHSTSTYLIDFFPEFLLNNPFKEPDKYIYPYKHVGLDFLFFVHQMDERLEILEEADKREMLLADFINWVINWAFCNNDDLGVEKYIIGHNRSTDMFVKNLVVKRGWENKKFLFNKKQWKK